MNIGLFNRQVKQYGEAEKMFRNVESLQRAIYGDKHEVLVYTVKQIGVCNLGLGQAVAAREALITAKELLLSIMTEEDEKETKEKDMEELAALENQLYVTYLLEKKLPEAIKCCHECIKILKSIHGDRS